MIIEVCDTLYATYLIKRKELLAKEVKEFQEVLKVYWRYFFISAREILMQKRHSQSRAPTRLPTIEEYQHLRDFTKAEIAKIVEDIYTPVNQGIFCKLRNLISCRLTLFNARRGGEATRLTLSELEESINSANFQEIYKIVKQFNENPGSLLKIVRQLNKSLEPYNMGADVESPDVGSGSLNLVLRQRHSDGESIYQGQLSFSTKPGVPANESEQVDSIRGGGGSTRPLKPSKDAGRTTTSDVLRRMSHDRTH